MPLPLLSIEIIALVYFLALWSGYYYYAKLRAKQGKLASLSHSLRSQREAWSWRLLNREMRMTDAALLASQERVVGFFSSTTLLMMAGVLTALTSSKQIADLASHIPFAQAQSAAQIEAKLALLLLILVYAFFKITWSLRQYGFAAVIIGAAPDANEPITDVQRKAFACNLAKLMDAAGHSNNSGLRAYYFGVSVIFWLSGTVPFLVATTITVYVLYRREFNSGTVVTIQQAYVAPPKARVEPARTDST